MRARRGGTAASRGCGVVIREPILRRLGLQLAYFSGYARLMQRRAGGAGAILRFERVRPARSVRVSAAPGP